VFLTFQAKIFIFWFSMMFSSKSFRLSSLFFLLTCNISVYDVLSINNSRFAEFLPLIYPPELEIKETTDTASSASFLDLYLEINDSGQLSTKILACFSDEDDVSGNQNNCYWTLHNESIVRCKHHMQEKLVYCCTYLENFKLKSFRLS
jgi:hypothetical protein